MAENYDYDLVVVGAGSGGITAAAFAAQLGARTALVEKARLGGDCTWTGCVPSKALIKAAGIAHQARTAARYGVTTGAPQVEMVGVREYVRGAIQEVYAYETPEALQAEGIDSILAPARFRDPHTIVAGDRTLTGKAFLLCTGAHPHIPDIVGLDDVPYLTYEHLFDNDRLPERLIVVGGGPIGVEMTQAYARLGAHVTLVAPHLLPRDEPEAAAVLEGVLAREGLQVVQGRASAVRREGAAILLTAGDQEVRGDMLLIATGRTPTVDGLNLEQAGVAYSPQGIQVDEHLQTTAKHIYAAGDCLGGLQFTHLAGWQAFQAARNALLPGSSAGFTDLVPWVTFSDPEVAHVGCTEAAARAKFGDEVRVSRREMRHVDRAVCEADESGFVKIVYKKDGTLLGATIVAGRAGEAITEFVVALQHGMKANDLAAPIHAYPTYSTPVQQMAAGITVANLLGSTPGKVIRSLSGLPRKPGGGESA